MNFKTIGEMRDFVDGMLESDFNTLASIVHERHIRTNREVASRIELTQEESEMRGIDAILSIRNHVGCSLMAAKYAVDVQRSKK